MNYLGKPRVKSIFPTALLLIMLLFSTGTMALASGDHEETVQEQDQGSYHVTLQTEPASVVTNEAASIKITVTNEADDKPVTNAQVTIQSSMENGDKNNGMSGMDNNTDGMDKPIKTVLHEQSDMNMQPGTYMADITFSQPGNWDQAVSITSPLGTSNLNFSISVAKSGPNYVFLGIVAGLVIIAGIVAGFIKKKHVAENGGNL